MVIGINCGHTVSGTIGSGAVGFINESDEVRIVGGMLASALTEQGHSVVSCTNDYANSTSENLSKIVSMANAQPLDLFVSIHFNSGGGKGCEVFTYGGKHFDEAERVCENLNGLGFVNRGIKDGSNLYVVRRSNAKAMLIEVCFVDTDTDVDLYKKLGAGKIAQAICNAITGEKSEDEGELTMTQYEELKQEISTLQAENAALKAEVDNLKNPMIYNYIDSNMPSWAHEAVQWFMDKGIIQGTGDGLGLDDTKLWLCTMLHRAIKFIARLINIKI